MSFVFLNLPLEFLKPYFIRSNNVTYTLKYLFSLMAAITCGSKILKSILSPWP